MMHMMDHRLGSSQKLLKQHNYVHLIEEISMSGFLCKLDFGLFYFLPSKNWPRAPKNMEKCGIERF